MQAANLISREDRDLMRRATFILLLLAFVTGLVSGLYTLYARKFFDVTGEAKWIWVRAGAVAGEPVAFFAVRDFELPAGRLFTHLKILGDPEYSVYLNGGKVAGRRVSDPAGALEGRSLALYDVSERVVTGRNRIVVAVRAHQGIGGLLASLDLAPETQNWLVTDADWRIYRRWSPELPHKDPAGVGWERPAIVGEPPIGRWNFPAIVRLPLLEAEQDLVSAGSVFRLEGLVPRIRMSGGIAVAVAERASATAFDFGQASGRLRLTMGEDRRHGSRALLVRFANHRDELALAEWSMRPVVFAPGETTITVPESRTFRYAMVFANGVQAEVLPDAPSESGQ